MKKITKLLLFFFTFLFLSCSDSVSQDEETGDYVGSDKHPNILLVIADDMSLDVTPNYLEELNLIKPVMPTLSNLMSTGLVFDNLWSYATCSPTRSSILTGKHGVETGVLEPSGGDLSGSHTSLQTYISEKTGNAYAQAVFGKWHLGTSNTHPTQTMGIETYSGNLGGGVSDYWSYDLVENEVSTVLTASSDLERKENYSTTKYTQLAIDWKNQQTKPWFLWLAYNAAHTPFHRPDDEMISDESIVRNETNLNNYIAMLEAMDYELGRFMDSLSEAEISNTVIIFIGDNGTPKRVAQFTDTDKHSKGSIYQGGINVPLIVSGAGTRVGRESEALIHTVDLYATIAEIAGANDTDVYNSQSFKNVLESEIAQSKEFVYTEVIGESDQGSYAVRNATYKLIYEIDTGKKELYNLLDDKYEETDIMLRSLTEEETDNLLALISEGERIRNE